MAITISGTNNVDKILATDGVLDSISGFNVVGVMTAGTFDVTGETSTGHLSVGSNIHIGNAGIITATTLVGNVTGNINHTSNLLLQISGSEKFRVGNGGQFGIAGANYGTAGQVFTSGGSGSAPTWSTINSDKITEGNTEAEVVDTGSDGHFKVTTEGSERFRIDSSGRILMGGTSSRDIGFPHKLQLEDNDTNPKGLSIISNRNTIHASHIDFAKTRGTSLGSNTIVQDDDYLGHVNFRGADGSDVSTQSSRISGAVDGTPGSNNVPGRIEFHTQTAGGSMAERLRIDSSGNMSLGKGAAASTNYGQNFQIHSNSTNGAALHLTDNSTGSSNSDGFHIISTSSIAYLWQRENANMIFGTNSSSRWNIYGSNGHFAPSTDSTYDIGTSSVRVRNGYFDTLYGDGSNLTGITGTTINNNADNRVITGSGSANTLNGESDLTFDGNQLYIDCNNYSYPIVINSTQASVRAVIRQTNDANANSGLAIQKKHSSLHPANYWYGDVSFEGWDGSGYHKAGLIECVAEGTPANDNMPGGLRFSTNAGAAGVTERLRIKPDGNVEVKTGNLVMTSGKGIDFSADGSGTLKTLPNSFNAELLHDYENGTFTPNIQYDTGTNRYAGSNVSSAVGEYIRIGDLVSFGMKITLTGNRNYSENIHLYIGGLPYNGMHSSFQSSMMNGWGGWACPTNDSNSSYKVHYCFHGYTTVNLRFSQSSGTGGISGFYVWGFYRTAP